MSTPSLKASKQATKKPSPALVIDGKTGSMKVVAKKSPSKPAKTNEARRRAEAPVITPAAASLGIEEMLGKPAPQKSEAPAAKATPKAAPTKTVEKYASQKEAVAAAIAADRGRTGVFEVDGAYLLGSRRRGLLKGWNYLGRAAALAGKYATT